MAEEIGILQRDACLSGEHFHDLFVDASEGPSALVECLQHAHDRAVGAVDGHAQDGVGAVPRGLVRATRGGSVVGGGNERDY
ncbi:MAG: hypothetical protein RIS22_1071 [Actinomycetota bacterium]